jgi:hypothetical protein
MNWRWTKRDKTAGFLMRLCAVSQSPAVDVAGELTAGDMAALVALGTRHGVASLLAERLQGRADLNPDRTLQTLRLIRQVNALRNEYLSARLIELTEEFERFGIELLVVKGPVLAQLAYADAGIRTYCDLDLLVNRRDILRAFALLQRHGHVANGHIAKAIASGFFQAVESNFTHPMTGVNVDLHWDLSPDYYPFGPTTSELWARAITIPFGGVTVRTLSHEDHLLYLMVHNARHGWASLSQVCDVAGFISRVALNWDTVRERAARTRCRTMLHIGLLVAAGLLGVKLPAAVLDDIRADRRSCLVSSQIKRNLITSDGASGAPLREIGRALAAIERRRDKLSYVAIRALQPTLLDWAWLPLAPPWYRAYYLIRPWRIARTAARMGAKTGLRWLGRSSSAPKIDRLTESCELGSNASMDGIERLWTSV